MNKNTLVGFLLAIVVLGGIYLIVKNKPMPPTVVQETPTGVSTPTQPGATPAVAGAPIAETSPNAGVSSSTAIVNGQVKPNGAATTYWFEYGTTTAFGTESSQQSVGSGYSLIPTPTYITGLRPSTLYYFRLNAKNSFAVVHGATYTFSTNTTPPVQGFAPAAHTSSATGISRTAATITGTVNPKGSPTSYWFEYGMDAGFGNVTALQSAGSGTASVTVSAPLAGLAPLTKYYFRLNAQNQYGTVNGAAVSFTTAGPAAASAPGAVTTTPTNISSTAATFTGRIDPNGAETTYWFEYSRDPLLAALIGAGTAPQTLAAGTDSVNVQANATGLDSKTTYYYRLVARNSAGTSRGAIVPFKTR